MQEILDKISVYGMQYGLNILAAALILLIGKWAAKIVSRITESIMLKSKVDQTLVSFTKNIAYYGILVFVCIAAIGKLGVQTSSFVALIGAAGLAVGLALQGSLANFAAGVMLVIFEPFKVGDTVETSGATGKVEEIQIFNTILSAPDKKKVIIPNAKITGDKIVIHPRA